MKIKWNIKDPLHPTTIARLLSEIEGAWYILDCLEDEKALFFMDELKSKYYKLYFQKVKEYKNK